MTVLFVERTDPLRHCADHAEGSLVRRRESVAAGKRVMRDVASVRVPAAARWLKLIRELLGNVAIAQGCGTACSRDLVLAVDEACQNVIRHAYGDDASGDILIEVRSDGVVLELEIIDFAPRVDPSAIGPRDLDDLRPGGLGTHFINECMDKVEFRSTDSGAGNRLWLSKTIS
jgi:sigma-B regulation protein RsbU (phosphoserine phosphatase)